MVRDPCSPRLKHIHSSLLPPRSRSQTRSLIQSSQLGTGAASSQAPISKNLIGMAYRKRLEELTRALSSLNCSYHASRIARPPSPLLALRTQLDDSGRHGRTCFPWTRDAPFFGSDGIPKIPTPKGSHDHSLLFSLLNAWGDLNSVGSFSFSPSLSVFYISYIISTSAPIIRNPAATQSWSESETKELEVLSEGRVGGSPI